MTDWESWYQTQPAQPALPGDEAWLTPYQAQQPQSPSSPLNEEHYGNLANPAADDPAFWADQSSGAQSLPFAPPAYPWQNRPPGYVAANDYYAVPGFEQVGFMGEAADAAEADAINGPYPPGYPQSYDAPYGFQAPLGPPPLPRPPMTPYSRPASSPPGQGDQFTADPYGPWRR